MTLKLTDSDVFTNPNGAYPWDINWAIYDVNTLVPVGGNIWYVVWDVSQQNTGQNWIAWQKCTVVNTEITLGPVMWCEIHSLSTGAHPFDQAVIMDVEPSSTSANLVLIGGASTVSSASVGLATIVFDTGVVTMLQTKDIDLSAFAYGVAGGFIYYPRPVIVDDNVAVLACFDIRNWNLMYGSVQYRTGTVFGPQTLLSGVQVSGSPQVQPLDTEWAYVKVVDTSQNQYAWILDTGAEGTTISTSYPITPPLDYMPQGVDGYNGGGQLVDGVNVATGEVRGSEIDKVSGAPVIQLGNGIATGDPNVSFIAAGDSQPSSWHYSLPQTAKSTSGNQFAYLAWAKDASGNYVDLWWYTFEHLLDGTGDIQIVGIKKYVHGDPVVGSMPVYRWDTDANQQNALWVFQEKYGTVEFHLWAGAVIGNPNKWRIGGLLLDTDSP